MTKPLEAIQAIEAHLFVQIREGVHYDKTIGGNTSN